MMQLRVKRIVAWVGMVCLAPGLALAVIPGADNPNVLTGHELRQATLSLNRRTMTDAYNAEGKKNLKWDADAVKFLDAMAIRGVNRMTDEPEYRIPGGVDDTELEKMTKTLAEAGCDDPLVQYFCALLRYTRNRDRAEAVPAVEKAVKGLMEGKYPIYHAVAAQHMLFMMLDRSSKKDQAYQKYLDAQLACIQQWEYKEMDRRLIMFQAWQYALDDGREREKQMADAVLAEEKLDPWVRNMILGKREIHLAWDARGSGWANTVSDAGWKGFLLHLSKAKDYLMTAYGEHPEHPEAAADMVIVAMGGGGELMLNEREWFEKSVTAQIDYPVAYDNYVYAIYPKWGGSIEQMHDFADECLETNRYDTRVPDRFIKTIEAMRGEEPTVDVWSMSGVFDNTIAMYEGYAKQHADDAQLVRWYKSCEAATAWRAKRYDDARSTMDARKGDIDPFAFRRVGAMGKLAMSHAYAMRSGLDEKITAAESAATASLDKGIAAYEALIKDLRADDKAAYFAKSRLRQLQWSQQYEKNEWVDLQPDKDLVGWDAQDGSWKVDESGALVGSYTGKGLWLACQAPFFDDNAVIEAKFEFSDSSMVAAGLGVTMRGLSTHYSIDLQRWSGKGFLLNRFYPGSSQDAELEKVNTLRCVYRYGGISADVNSKRLIDSYDIAAVIDQPPHYLAISGASGSDGATVRVTGIRVRKLRDDETRYPKD